MIERNMGAILRGPRWQKDGGQNIGERLSFACHFSASDLAPAMPGSAFFRISPFGIRL
jgi:hypothetical protein